MRWAWIRLLTYETTCSEYPYNYWNYILLAFNWYDRYEILSLSKDETRDYFSNFPRAASG